jgi:hypothetical protein
MVEGGRAHRGVPSKLKFRERPTDISGTMADQSIPAIAISPVALVGGPAWRLLPRPSGSRLSDDFVDTAGPDIRVDGPDGPTSLSAIFTVDPDTAEVQVAVVDDRGRLVRLIPQDSLSELLITMHRYGGGG